LNPPPRDPQACAEFRHGRRRQTVSHSHRTVVYVVEDDASVRRSLERLLRYEGYDVRPYESAKLFLDEVTPEPSACLLLDITLPRLSGLEVLRRLDEREIGLPVIVVSARDDDEARLEARRLGAKFYFRKPVDDRTLIDAIDWAVSSDPAQRTDSNDRAAAPPPTPDSGTKDEGDAGTMSRASASRISQSGTRWGNEPEQEVPS
jgi:DNA-binding response OmpR family regulator